MSVMRRPTARLGAEAVRWTFNGSTAASKTTTRPWTCAECRGRIETRKTRIGSRIEGPSIWKRHFSSTMHRRDEESKPITTSERTPITPPTSTTDPKTPASSSSSLPSHTASQRSQLSNRVSKIVDQVLARASLASQHINAYTGTDYSGIESLRKEITAQEQKVRTHHSEVEEAKASHHTAHAKQTAAQREIVGLLERKSSWSPADLERYMSLVRSEHLNDQHVQVARDNLMAAERSLEDARSLLEKLERKQYHEEQVWSDTIRRNSTWVTFGLMGVNILLLLAQIAIFEPYRRRKIVREVKAALDEKTSVGAGVVEVVDKGVQTEPSRVEEVKEESKQPLDVILPPAASEDVGKTPLAAGEMLPSEAADVAGAVPSVKEPEKAPLPTGQPKTTLEAYQESLRDLFSERIVQLRKVDVTNTALQGAATGVAVMGLIFVLLRPR